MVNTPAEIEARKAMQYRRARMAVAKALASGGGKKPSIIVPTAGILAASRGQINTSTITVTQPYTSRRTYWAHGAGDISNLQLVYINRYLSGVAAGAAGSAHDVKVFVEYPAGTFYPVTFGGLSTFTRASGARVKSDVVAGLTIPAGAKFWVRTVILTSTSLIPCIALPISAQTLGLDDGNVAADQGNSGTISPTTTVNTVGPNAIIGTVNATNAKSFVILGDSLTFGTGDEQSVGPRDGSGFVARLLDAAGLPYFKWAIGGQQAADAATIQATIAADTAATLMDFSDVICAYGVNDLRLGRTKAQIETDYQTIYAVATFAGKRKYQTTITPRSDSTDGYATTTFQTPKIDGNMAALNPLNADIRAGLANVYNYIEAADAAMSARDSDIHKAPPAGTSDGTHFNSIRAALVASLLSL